LLHRVRYFVDRIFDSAWQQFQSGTLAPSVCEKDKITGGLTISGILMNYHQD
jgi:hypothetical protein